MIADTLIQHLEGLVVRGDHAWYARCPAHEDKSPSLSIREAEDKILIHCFAGCPTEDVLTAVGLTWSDLYPDRWQAAYRGATASQGRKFTDRLLRDTDPMELERLVLRIAAAELRAGKALSVEDMARVEVARLRLRAAEEDAAI